MPEPVRFVPRQTHAEWLLTTTALSDMEPQEWGLGRVTRRYDIEPELLRMLIGGSQADKPLCIRSWASVEQGVAEPACLVPREECFQSVLFVAPVATTEGQNDSLTSEPWLDVDTEILVLSTGRSDARHLS